jgi:hypothetical protein
VSTVQCQAITKAGHQCPRPGSHLHTTQIGTPVRVCGTHVKVLRKRERLGSDEEALQEWGVIPTPTPSPGQTTPLTSPSPPLPVDG